MTAPSPSRTSNSARVLIAGGAGVAIFGLLWATCNVVSGGRFPIREIGVGNLWLALVVVGVVLIITGATRPRVLRA